MATGYIYVLANSSMPDLIKVGKTNRHPGARAQELSGVTGVPTPFIVIYEQYVNDCEAAEAHVHTILSRKGYRVSDKREFFRAPAKDAVEAILSLPKHLIKLGTVNSESSEPLTYDDPDEYDELDGAAEDENEPTEPWFGLWDKAEDFYFGHFDEIQDYGEALKLYKDAAKLGCNLAYYRIADIYRQGGCGVQENEQMALDYYKEGGRKGIYACWLEMTQLFYKDGNIKNAEKCLKFFFRDRKALRSELIESKCVIINLIIHTIVDCLPLFQKLSDGEILVLRDERCELREEIEKKLTTWKQKEKISSAQDKEIARSIVEDFEAVKDWILSLDRLI
jgi:hypothetical protein